MGKRTKKTEASAEEVVARLQAKEIAAGIVPVEVQVMREFERRREVLRALEGKAP